MKKTVLMILVVIVFYCVSCSNEPVAQPSIEIPVTTPVSTPAATLTPLPEPTPTPRPAIPIAEDGYILTCSDYDLNNNGQKDFFGFREDSEYHDDFDYKGMVPVMMLDYYRDGELTSIRLWNPPYTSSEVYPFSDELPTVKEFAVGDYDDDGFLEIAVLGIDSYVGTRELVIKNIFGTHEYFALMDSISDSYYGANGYAYIAYEFASNIAVYSDDMYSSRLPLSGFAGMYPKSNTEYKKEFTPKYVDSIDHIEQLGNMLLCRQPIDGLGKMWYALQWIPSKDEIAYNQHTVVEEWFQLEGTQRDTYRGYQSISGHPIYGSYGALIGHAQSLNLLDRVTNYELSAKGTTIQLMRIDFDSKEEIVLLSEPWELESLIWGITADVDRDKQREFIIVGKDTNGKCKLGVVTALAKKPQLYTLEFDTQSIETAEIVPYKDMYVINCLVKDTSDKQEWQAYKFDNGKFVGLTQKDVADNHPAKLFREKQK